VFPQALLLAGPGVLVGAYLMGSFVFYCVPSIHWSWNLCMLFGSILSATDPVAVVALLKDAGASPKLTILIIGESLMNDGTAMVLFTLYYNIMKGEKYSVGDILLFFMEEVLGAPLLGMALGLVAVYCLSKVNRLAGDWLGGWMDECSSVYMCLYY
jgi:NhaP-type Na+/H+ or K+/H+ antiporter